MDVLLKRRGRWQAGRRIWRNVFYTSRQCSSPRIPAGLVESIRNGFSGSFESPPRLHQTIPGADPSMLLIMPAWQRGGDIGIKMVTVDARRSRQGGEAVNGVDVLLDGASGAVARLLDARGLTGPNPAAASSRASSLLSRKR